MEETFPIISKEITCSEFHSRFLVKNTPCLIKREVGILDGWNSFKDWTNYDGEPDVVAICDISKVKKVPVSNCAMKYFNTQVCFEMTFKEYLDYWNGSKREKELLYLKDWHFVQESPHYEAYSVPKYFKDDWLNEYLDHVEENDYKFVYVGPEGSWTPFHTDVFGSYSWSANVCGRKEWLFFPPGEELKLKGVFDVTEFIDENTIDDLSIKQIQVKGEIIKYYKVIQNTGDVVFVPSGWWHQVKNLKDTISINHNWFNVTNIYIVFKNLQDELERVKVEISDCKPTCSDKEWDQICEDLLMSSFGMNFDFMRKLCCYIVESRSLAMKSGSKNDETILDELRTAKALLNQMNEKAD